MEITTRSHTLRPGVVVAPVTPMNQDMSLDTPAIALLTDRLIAAGATGLTPCAVTGEPQTLSLEEHLSVLRATVAATRGRVPVYCGVGRPSIIETWQAIDSLTDMGADGVFLITPYASQYSLGEVLHYFQEVADRTPLPIMIYNCPSYSGVNIPPQALATLARVPNIQAVKEGNQAQLGETLALVRSEDFAVYSARDSYLLESLAAGAAGVISFAANVAPELVVAVAQAWGQSDFTRARALQMDVTRLVQMLVLRSYPLMIKLAMDYAGVPAGPCRRVRVELSAEESSQLRRNALAAARWRGISPA